MKKVLSLILSFAMVTALCACGSGSDEQLAEMQAQIDALYLQLNSEDAISDEYDALKAENEALKAENEALKAELAEIKEGSSNEQGALSDTQLFIADAVNSILQSESFSAWQELYTNFTTEEPSRPKVISAIRYQIGDFEKTKMDCYLINLSADIAYWDNEASQQGSVENNLFIFIDNLSGAVYDNISTNAFNAMHDVSTPEGKATYLLWTYGFGQLNSSSESLLNNSEIITPLSEEDIGHINNLLTIG